MKTLSFTDARANLKAAIDRVVADRAPLLITRQRGENAVLVSASEWAGMEETLHLLSSPANAKHLMDGIARLDARQVRSTSSSNREADLRRGRVVAISAMARRGPESRRAHQRPDRRVPA